MNQAEAKMMARSKMAGLFYAPHTIGATPASAVRSA